MMTNDRPLEPQLASRQGSHLRHPSFRSAQAHDFRERTGCYLILLRQHHAARHRWRATGSIRSTEAPH